MPVYRIWCKPVAATDFAQCGEVDSGTGDPAQVNSLIALEVHKALTENGGEVEVRTLAGVVQFSAKRIG